MALVGRILLMSSPLSLSLNSQIVRKKLHLPKSISNFRGEILC